MLGVHCHVFIDSDYRDSGTSGSFGYRLNLPKNEKYDSVAVLQASVPKTYYLVRSGHNTFTLTENGLSATITITPGNYSMASFRTVLQAAMVAGSPRGYTYTVTQPATASAASTGKYTFAVTGNGGVQPIITFPSSSLIYLQLGFDFASTNTFAANTLTSANVVNFNSVIGMMIKCDMIDNVASDETHGGAVLQEIFNFNTTDFSNIGFQNSNVVFNAKRLKNVGSLPSYANFTITDTNDQVLDFNGGSLNFSLVFFQRDNYHDAALRDLKMRWMTELAKDVGQ